MQIAEESLCSIVVFRLGKVSSMCSLLLEIKHRGKGELHPNC
jgi:hypothetical protein